MSRSVGHRSFDSYVLQISETFKLNGKKIDYDEMKEAIQGKLVHISTKYLVEVESVTGISKPDGVQPKRRS